MHRSMLMTLLVTMFILFVLEDEVKCARFRAGRRGGIRRPPGGTTRRRTPGGPKPRPPTGGSGGSRTECDRSIGNAAACAAVEGMIQSAIEKIWNTGRPNTF